MKQQKQDVSNYLHHLRGMQATKARFLSEAPVPAVAPAAPPVDPMQDQMTVDPNQEALQGVSQEATADIQKGAITLEMVIDKFNTIRAGKSFKDKSIKQQMMQYFEKLTDDEKVALYAFLKGIAQIVSGEFTGYSPVSPSAVGAPPAAPGVEPAAAEAAPPSPPAPAPAPAAPTQQAPAAAPPPPVQPPQKKVIKTIKPNIIKRQAAPRNPGDGSSSPIPITPKVR